MNFKHLTPVTNQLESLISFNDLEKLIRICEEYNELVSESDKQIRIDRSRVKAPILDYTYCLTADIMMNYEFRFFNSPYVILFDEDHVDYVVINLRKLQEKRGDLARLITDVVL